MVEQPGRSLMDELLDMLRDKHLLLVLDNCEHVLPACTQLVEILLAAPEVSFLATSLETLDIKFYPAVEGYLPTTRQDKNYMRYSWILVPDQDTDDRDPAYDKGQRS